jgi:hypothetical protein
LVVRLDGTVVDGAVIQAIDKLPKLAEELMERGRR